MNSADILRVRSNFQTCLDETNCQSLGHLQPATQLFCASPLTNDLEIERVDQAIVAVGLNWLSAFGNLYLIAHRTRHAVLKSRRLTSEQFQSLWHQALRLSFTAELFARMTYQCTPMQAWITGLIAGLTPIHTRLRSQPRTGRAGGSSDACNANLYLRDIAMLLSDFDLVKSLPVLNSRSDGRGPWNVCSSAATFLGQRDKLTTPMVKLFGKIPPVSWPTGLQKPLTRRLEQIDQRCWNTSQAIWKLPRP